MCVCLVLLRGLRADINEAFLSAELCQYNKPLTWLITALLPLCVCVSMCVFLCARTAYDAITYVFCESLLEPAWCIDHTDTTRQFHHVDVFAQTKHYSFNFNDYTVPFIFLN